MAKICPINLCDITDTNKFIQCPHCDFKACLDCCKQSFLLSLKEGKEHLNCLDIGCDKIWDDDFMYKNFPKKFLKKDIKKYQADILFEKEKSMYPQTIEIISRKKKIKKLEYRKKHYLEKIKEINREVLELTDYRKNNKQIKKKINIIRKCPNKDCIGYLNDEYICGICDLVLCSDCEIVKDNNEHKCNDDDIKTVEIKHKTCKPCPNCGAMSIKDGGCSQIYCGPPCNGGKGTAWNFNTGEIDNGPIHSPDYYDYMRNNNNGIVPRQQCLIIDTLPEIWDLHRIMDPNDYIKITEIHRFFSHLKHYEMRKFRDRFGENNFDRNLELRLNYLTNQNDMTEKDLKKVLYDRNKKLNKNKSIYQNLDTLYNVGLDIFNQLIFQHKINKKTNFIDTVEIYQSLENIRTYYNDIIIRTKDRYDCKSLNVSRITIDWVFKH